MRSVAATLAGGGAAAMSVLMSISLRVRRLARAASVSGRAWTATAAMLVASAALEELLFRVGLVTVLDDLATRAIAVGASALLFALPHLARGETRAERCANAATAAAFGGVTALLWLRYRSLPANIGYHAGFNLVGGLILGGGAVAPLRRERRTPVWPFAQSRPSAPDAASVVLAAAAEIMAIAATGLLLLVPA